MRANPLRRHWRASLAVCSGAAAVAFMHIYARKRRKRETRERARLASLKVPRAPSRVDTFRGSLHKVTPQPTLRFGGGDAPGAVPAPWPADASRFFRRTALRALLDGGSQASRDAIAAVRWTRYAEGAIVCRAGDAADSALASEPGAAAGGSRPPSRKRARPPRRWWRTGSAL